MAGPPGFPNGHTSRDKVTFSFPVPKLNPRNIVLCTCYLSQDFFNKKEQTKSRYLTNQFKQNNTYTFPKTFELEPNQMKIFSVNLNQATISLGLSLLPQINITECSGSLRLRTWPVEEARLRALAQAAVGFERAQVALTWLGLRPLICKVMVLHSFYSVQTKTK